MEELENQEMVVNALLAVMEAKLASGQLTPDVYSVQLTEAVQYDTRLALALKAANRVSY